ncbi:DUF943 family protein [Pseudomonas sp. QL9]|uniref:DUF943 family protein n=1 Tax=Pseudomonas sp. QL9 TaxID=3242725 RepID=UPI003529E62A
MKRMFLILPVVISLCLFDCGVWWASLPTKIDAVHRNGNFSDVLVSPFPLTDSGRIEWWENNKAHIKAEYGIPEPKPDGYFEILFWSWDGIYRVDHGTDEDSDLRCFADMPGKANCIVKSNIPLQVTHLRDGGFVFDINRGERLYSRKESGGELSRRQDWERVREKIRGSE